MQKLLCLSLCLFSLISCKKHEEHWRSTTVNTYSEEAIMPVSRSGAQYTIDRNGNVNVTGSDQESGEAIHLTEQIVFDTAYVCSLGGDEYANLDFKLDDCALEIHRAGEENVLYYFNQNARTAPSWFNPAKPSRGSLFYFVSDGKRIVRFFEGPYGTQLYKSYDSYILNYRHIVSLSGEYLGEFKSKHMRLSFGEAAMHPDQYLWTDPLTCYFFLLSQQHLVYMYKLDLTQEEYVWDVIHTLPEQGPGVPQSSVVKAWRTLLSPWINLEITATYEDGSTKTFALNVDPDTGEAVDK